VADTARRLAERSDRAGIALPSPLAARLVVYYDLLERWNRKINLTSLAQSDEAIDRLLLEPIAAASWLPPSSRLMDLGSGGGSPAIPLALALESPVLVMVESRSRKAAFLREAARAVGLNAIVENARFEDLDYANAMDVVSIRAVKLDAPTLAVASRFLKPGGTMALFQSDRHQLPSSLPPALTSRAPTSLLTNSVLQLLDKP
jgi:16S rRNA (guanine527-N7)-methyltransferase